VAESIEYSEEEDDMFLRRSGRVSDVIVLNPNLPSEWTDIEDE
jgi:hypothetical protein